MVFTRGKNPSNADEDRNPERSVQDDGEPEPLVLERSSSRIKERSLEEGRETPSVMGSIKSQSVLRTSSRTTSRKGTYILDVSVEETPLSQRHSLSQSGKGKRLKLYSEEQPSGSRRGNTKYSEGHSSESVDEQEDHHKHMSKRQQWNPVESDEQVENHDEDAFENTNGIRRSTRTRKLTYGTFNTSWLFGTQSAKGYPCMDPQEEEDEENKRSTKMRTRQRGNTIDEEHNHISDGDEASRDTTNNLRSPSQKRTSRRVCVMKKEPQYEDDMYSRVKRLPRSANHYKNYRTTTVSSAKRTRNVQPSRRSSRYNQLPSSDDDSSLESEVGNENEEGSDSGAEDNHNEPNGEEKERAENGQVNANANDSGQMVDGRRVKGNYLLRKIQPMVDRFQPMDLKQRGDSPPRLRAGSNRRAARMICSPAHRTLRKRRQRAQNASSTSSSSSDDERFERRKNKSMVKARNRCLPMNFSPDDVNQGVIKDRMKIGSSLADVDPMNIDRNVTFEQVGGLETYIRSLKEMILFPLLYPEVFQKFAIQAPRGVLFYGPPGTGKTLVARALANECGQKDRRVAFFMRKGADCLSKWVGESERQLRLLFDQAYQMRPSIIFFDEIDGLAPVRSTRQDQIHSSIVSTLLALMDGLDSRGEVIIIGATNRLDAIDPALRRPGRFDREFHFPLPSLPARKEILGIHLKSWQPAPPASLIHHLSEKTVGYCGADLKALCAEAALLALRRRYPQVYASKDKLQLDLSQINVERRDFVQAVQRLVPASQRSTSAAGKPLADVVAPLLSNSLHLLIQHTQRIFPNGMAVLRVKGPLSGSRRLTSNQFSPRLLITGDSCSQLASALLHYMERLPVHRLDLTTLYGLSVRNPEEACVQLFQEARRNVPSIIYLPQVSRWWPAINETVRATFLSLLTELDPELPILLLATHDSDLNYCAEDVVCLFDADDDEIFVTALPSSVERRNFFHPVVVEKSLRAPFTKKKNREQLEVLPLAEAAPERQLNDAEKARVERNEEATLCELRIFLREILAKMARNKLFFMFTRPVDTQEVPDYLEIIHKPMDLETMMTKIDQHCYESAKDFLADIDQICANALEYNPDRDPEDKLIRHRACTLRDTACALIKAEMDTDFEEQCQEISRTRKARLATVEPPVETKNPADVTAVQTPGEIDSAVTTQTSIKDNGEKQESADTSATRKRRKASAWSRGNPTSRRYHKKNKIDMDSSTTNATHDTLNNHGQTNGIDANPSASLLDMSSKTIDTAERTTSSQGSLPSVEVSLALDSSVAPTDACTAIDDSMLSESHCSDVADPPDADQAAETSTLPVTDTPLPVKVVHIDTNQLEQLLGKLVTQTEHYSLNRLLRLYSKLNRVVVRFSKLWDRTLLIKELEAVVDRSNTAEK